MLKLHLVGGRGSLAAEASAEAPSGKGESWALVLTGSSVSHLSSYLQTVSTAVLQQPSQPPILASDDQCYSFCLLNIWKQWIPKNALQTFSFSIVFATNLVAYPNIVSLLQKTEMHLSKGSRLPIYLHLLPVPSGCLHLYVVSQKSKILRRSTTLPGYASAFSYFRLISGSH